jgi:hypothetical protein
VRFVSSSPPLTVSYMQGHMPEGVEAQPNRGNKGLRAGSGSAARIIWAGLRRRWKGGEGRSLLGDCSVRM